MAAMAMDVTVMEGMVMANTESMVDMAMETGKKIQKNPAVRQMENDVLIPMLRELVEEGKQVRVTVSGSSMSPLICHRRDSVLLESVQSELKKGDIVFYQRNNGQYVLHRICRIDEEGKVYCIGDAQTEIEGPLEKGQIFAIVKGICRKDRWICPGDFWWEFFAHVWLNLIPFRKGIMAVYSRIRRLGR